ncbi:MAG: glycoside hydrolase family 43 protein, partial [Candidatus Goldbacteria bacterium]|nr:glycoside hydrolase family 43 protein [Candidatus Goldiibacteriota bacterium]
MCIRDRIYTGKYWFAVFLGVRTYGYDDTHNIGRETFLCPVTWADDGFPIFGDNGKVHLEMESPLKPYPVPKIPPKDDFNSEKLAFYWNYLRNPDEKLYSLKERPGFLRLKGSKYNLFDIASPTWLGRRQCHHNVKVTVSIEFKPEKENEEAGLCVRKNEKHHYEIFLTKRKKKLCVVLRKTIADLTVESAFKPLPNDFKKQCILAIHADLNNYTFLFGKSKNNLKILGKGITRYLSSEIAGGFTGVYFAMYATGNGKPCKNPADFDWFEYLI